MTEYENRQAQPIPLLLPGPDGTIYRFRTVADLLPFQFSANDLPDRSS
jgi:cytidine deaminase